VRAVRSNGLPAVRDLPIKFKRQPATVTAAIFDRIVGKETDHAKHSPHEYVSEDGRWVIRAVHHTGYGVSNSGRVRWYVIHDGHCFAINRYSGQYALSLEGAIDEIHHRIGRGICDGFMVLVQMRQDAEDREREAARLAAKRLRAAELLGYLRNADPAKLIGGLAMHVDLDALASAIAHTRD
jgi:hypothetical protein